MFAEAYLEPSQTSTMELFGENSWRLVAINYFCTSASSSVDVWLGSKYASGSLDEPCEIAPLNSFILQYYVITSLSFVFEKENITLKNIWYLISQALYSFINTTGMFKFNCNYEHS